MFNKTMVPVDLRHVELVGRALAAAADLAKHYDAEVCYVAVASPEPSDLGHSPAEAEERLRSCCAAETRRLGHCASAHLVVSHDPAADLDRKLQEAVEQLGADLVVMATHVPNVTDYVWASHGGALALHSNASVMLVRG